MQVAGIPCNLAKAFHCASKKLRSSDLSFYGIQCTPGQWFKSYIHERKKIEKIHYIQTIENAYNGGHKMSIHSGFDTWFYMPFHICVCVYIYIYIYIYICIFPAVNFQFKPTPVTIMILVLFWYYYFTSTDQSKIA
jgi:lipoprotein signal peptidase